MNKIMKRLKLVVALLVPSMLLLGVGCVPSPSSNTPTPTPVKTNTEIDITSDEDTTDVVTADVYGKDLDFVERYPDSLRSYYSSNEYETDVTYQTTAGIDDVRAFYDAKLKAAGWTNSEEATDYMEYTRGDEANPEILTLYLTEYSNQGLLEYELVYEPVLTDDQLDTISNQDFN